MKRTTSLLLPLLLTLTACSARPMWPTTEVRPVEPLGHPTWKAVLDREGIDGTTPYRLAIFGDQRALADGEFQALIRAIAGREGDGEKRPPLLALIDSGDIVDNGKHSDQFAMLADILAPADRWPYLVAAGNHELDRDLNPEARDNYVAFMGEAPGPRFERHRLWYRKDAPGLRVLFLDSNQWVYGPNEDQPAHKTEQLAWLSSQMAEDFEGRTLVVMHHPFIISNKKHRNAAARMWSVFWASESLADMFARGGVDLLVVGHTHTFERYRLTSPDGVSFHYANISGRPRNSFLWFGAGARRATDIRGREFEHHVRVGWKREDLEGWKIEQLDFMAEDEEANQWGELTIHPDGRMEMEMFFLVEGGGYRSGGKFAIE